MSRLIRWLPLLLGLGLLLLLWHALTPAQVDDEAGLNRPLPELTLTTLEGQRLSTAQLLGRPFLLNIWASWCANCRSEHPLLLEIGQSLPILGISYRDKPAAARAWLESAGNPYQLVLDDGDGALGLALGVVGTPESWLVSADGRLLARHRGVLTKEAWQRHFLPLLERP